MKTREGFTLVEIMIVVAIIGMLAAIAIPNFVKNRQTAQKTACANNLRLIDAGKEQWAMETGQAEAATVVTTGVDAYLKGSTSPVCPAKGTYNYGAVGVKPLCSVAAHTGIY
jgi:prepilin-type N-terminal cleavage/methylation domain-containing protein